MAWLRYCLQQVRDREHSDLPRLVSDTPMASLPARERKGRNQGLSRKGDRAGNPEMVFEGPGVRRLRDGVPIHR